ncbi:hypothetical protein B0H67DRAFT_645041 [Lasiosphaeris hirsuta]|uniref:DUF7730 domain-containing protein n=1 Tax=Lasiosphaeris hirsuta TaxID=260670 RepID=A0AA40AG81_9PEZI|nr:hypothetical protein B0H67DRAFT_645041 [Lasiosphaeris hirsuta]
MSNDLPFIDWRTPSTGPMEYTFPPPDRDVFIATADPQSDSLFFSLPPEIRRAIYAEFWRVSGLRQHIVSVNDRDPVLPREPAIPHDSEPHPQDSDMYFRGYIPPRIWAHVPCRTGPGEHDERYAKFNAATHHREKREWASRLRSEWCGHWACEESRAAQLLASGFPRLSHRPDLTFLPVLLTSKRMYLECLPSLYSSLTFIFTDLTIAFDFLIRYTPTLPLRSLELHIRATPLLTELYYPTPSASGPAPTVSAGPLSASHNPWARVCDLLATQPALHSLRIWFDTRDLRPWAARVSETRLFAGLFAVRVVSQMSLFSNASSVLGGRARFLLELPELPESGESEGTAAVRRGLGPEHFLEGDEVLARAPFTVVRGARPDNWQVYHFWRQ